MLFISMTRSKGWLFMSGHGENAEKFRIELEGLYSDVKKEYLNLDTLVGKKRSLLIA